MLINQLCAYSDHFSVDICHATVHPKNVTAKVGEGVQFVCVVRGFGQNYSIKWYDIYNNALPTISHTHVLDVPVVQENGSYYCVVSNASGIQVRTLGVLEVVGKSYVLICSLKEIITVQFQQYK